MEIILHKFILIICHIFSPLRQSGLENIFQSVENCQILSQSVFCDHRVRSNQYIIQKTTLVFSEFSRIPIKHMKANYMRDILDVHTSYIQQRTQIRPSECSVKMNEYRFLFHFHHSVCIHVCITSNILIHVIYLMLSLSFIFASA